jgi:hypothetical protein
MQPFKTALLLSIVVFINITLFAQQEEIKQTKKVVIVKKTDINGKVDQHRLEAEGDEADKLIREINLENDLSNIDEGVTSTQEKSISITKDDDGNSVIKIVKSDGKDQKVIEWSGKESEMPSNIKEELGDDVEIEAARSEDGKMTIKIDQSDSDTKGKKMVIVDKREIRSDNDDSYINGRTLEIPRNKRSKNSNIKGIENQVTLGIMINEQGEGVVVDNVVSGSVAEKAGIRPNDTILKIDDAYIFSTRGLLKTLHAYKLGDKTKITYLHQGKEITKKITF